MIRGVFFLFLIFWGFSVEASDLLIETQQGVLRLETEIADTPEKRRRGLMFRASIPDDYGMVFLFPQKEVIYMWMKNTFIPLDMIFFDENGQIVHIKKEAVPHDLKYLSSQKPVVGVVEINAGFCDKNNVRIGDKILLQN